MRIHTVAAVYVLVFARFFSLSAQDYALLFITISLVLCSEMFNTACERLCDLCCGTYSRLVRVVKDISAGAVLICAIFALAVAAVFFSDTDGYIRIFKHYAEHPWLLILFGFSLIIAAIYIIAGPKRIFRFVKKCRNSSGKS